MNQVRRHSGKYKLAEIGVVRQSSDFSVIKIDDVMLVLGVKRSAIFKKYLH